MTDLSTLRIDSLRLWNDILRSAEIGPGDAGGLCRLALTDADKQMRDEFVSWCRAADLQISVDHVGNIFARRDGVDNSLAPVVIGSHLDTQVAGGRYDGILGVLAGLEVIRTLNQHEITTRRPLELVNWSNEEGARFNPPMIASGAFAGVFDVQWVLDQKDDDGLRFGDELEHIGYAGKTLVGGRELDSYFELHIEQGVELQDTKIEVGLVTGGYATYGMHVDIHGECAHSGPTPMDKRKNALVGAAMLAVAVNEIGWRYHPLGKSTVPRIQCWPNKAGILPAYAQLTVDCRHPDPETTDSMVEEIRQAMVECADKANVEMEVAQCWTFGDEVFDPDLLDLLRESCDELETPYLELMSQAGHDAYHISKIAPTALIFSPCRDGISHNEAEHIELSYTEPSVNALLHAVLKRANRSS